VGASACGAGAGGEGALKGVTLSFWPGNGSNPAIASRTMTTTAIPIQILMAIQRVMWRSEMPVWDVYALPANAMPHARHHTRDER
jgi:hypothetical protein